MKKKILILLFPSIILVGIIFYFTNLNKSVIAESSSVSSGDATKTKQSQDEMIINPTIKQAIERAKQDPEFWNPEFWESEGEFNDSTTILAVDGSFLNGEMKDEKTDSVFNSDTDPNATTLGEIREAIKNNQ